MALMSKPTDDPKVSRWWWRPLRTWVYGLVDPLWAAFRGENSDDIALSNVTSINGVSSTELTVLDGLTATTAELNLLAGLTATSAELNKSDRTQADGIAEASKVTVLDANKDIFGKRIDINQSLLEAVTMGPYMHFQNDADEVVIANNANLQWGKEDWSYTEWLRPEQATGSYDRLRLIEKWGTAGYYIKLHNDRSIETSFAGGVSPTISGSLIRFGFWNHLAVVFDRDGDVSVYVNGQLQGTADISSDSTDLSGTDDLSLGKAAGGTSQSYTGDRVGLLLFNRVLSASEVRVLAARGTAEYADLGATLADLVTNGDDWTGATGSTPPNSWSDSGSASVTYIIRDNTGVANMDDKVLEIDVSGSGSKTLSQGVFQTGKRYRVTFAYRNLDGSGGATKVTFGSPANSATLQNTTIAGDGIVFTQDVLADGPDLAFEVTTDGALQIDDVQVVQIGCVLALSPGGIGHLQWQDAGGNELHGTVTGALPGRLPIDHVERYIRKGITADTTLTGVVPAGYRIRGITVEETAGNAITGGLKIGTSAGGAQVVNAQAVGANALVDCALGARLFSLTTAQTLYVEDVTAWNSASIDLYLEMERIK